MSSAQPAVHSPTTSTETVPGARSAPVSGTSPASLGAFDADDFPPLGEAVLRGPDGFDAFWQVARDEALAVNPQAERVEVLSREDGRVVTRVRFRTTDGIELGGWLSEPAEGPVRRVVVRLHGYGGAEGPHDPLDLAEAAELTPVLRGLPTLGLVDGIPTTGDLHVLHGIAHRDTYVHRGCVQDAWVSVTVALRLVPGAQRVDLTGSSFGGGIGALALPLEDRVTAACLDVPSFGNHPARLETPCAGSGESVRLAALDDPSVRDVVAYFDAATAAARVRQPVLVSAARVDPVVPPVGQLSVYYALGGPRSLLLLTAGHSEYPEQEREGRLMRAAYAEWLRA